MTLRIPAEVVERVREHALVVHETKPDHESLGCLVLDGDARVAVRYARIANVAGHPERARLASESQLRRPGGLPLVVTHSHPVGDATPSDLDLRWAAHLGLDTFAIYSLTDDELRFWRLDGDGVAEISYSVAA